MSMTYAANAPSDSPVNYALIAIAQEVAELLNQSYAVQADEIDGIGLMNCEETGHPMISSAVYQ
ncbi:hypothetical protein ACQ4M4_11935 [Leptolyngbya sp. AN02str]|uniref:hypothetical protein n=1 Tax=Leptolyngbya sp. AN02str TaxID=3423363 RepID=UPI003D31FF21